MGKFFRKIVCHSTLFLDKLDKLIIYLSKKKKDKLLIL